MKKIEQRTMTDKELLQEYIRIAITHVKRMKAAFTYLKNTVPLKDGDIENLTDMQVAFIDQIVNRFAQLQDLIGAKIFPSILEILKEDAEHQSMIDKLNALEKLDYLPSVDDWDDLRKIRNTVSHQYPQNDSYMVIHINKILNAAITLLDYWQELCKKLDGVLEKAK